ncbi:S41 family peptidase [Sphingomonas soli]|uniref:S41 family peptidase n=1 Tax=Sphingomonas soli TaxID=266127 RepID=UPI00082D8917|nr:S41 family peptidase [Sphingomonas soli]
MSLLAALLLLQSAPGVSPPPADWAARLREDATAFRDAVMDSHPGPVNAEDPGFTARLDRAYARALDRARTAAAFPHYVWALRELTAAFDDGHVGVEAAQAEVNSYPWRYRWAGIVTALRGDAHVVVSSEEAAVPAGAVLERCDGQAADSLAADRIGRFSGRWVLRSRREANSGALLLPADNPWLPTIRTCSFAVKGARRTVKLNWRPLTAERRSELLAAATGTRFTTGIGIERLGDGTVWINAGSFDGNVETEQGRALAAMTKEVDRWAPEIRSAPRMVFDLRGNGGGSSTWTNAMASSLWGAATADRAVPDTAVDWRTSDANYNTVTGYVERFTRTRASNEQAYQWVVAIEAGLRSARERGDKLWRQAADVPPPANPLDPKVTAKAFVLTDFGCASACLDAVDLLTALGAVQVGQETSADTLYMEIRGQAQPSGARVWIPMKVYRDRKRGSNEPVQPTHRWTGDMGDTEAIRRWIAGL